MAEPSTSKPRPRARRIKKCPTGIRGFDDVSSGGLPARRVTLVRGGPGCGKSLFGLAFLVEGAERQDEPGVLVSFDETEAQVLQNVASLDWDLKGLVKRGAIAIEHVALDPGAIAQDDAFSLEGLLIRIENALDATGAKRLVLDTIDALFAAIGQVANARREIARLFRWLQAKQVTVVVTGEGSREAEALQSLVAFAADCVVVLDNRVQDQLAVRRLRILKYRGSSYGPNEYPFLIADEGLSLLPITSIMLREPGTSRCVSTGVSDLDALFKRRGVAWGSATLLSGGAGTGKTNMAAAFALASCERGERCLFVSYEESAGQLVHNLRSIGIDLAPWIARGALRVIALRPSFYGLEKHLYDIYRAVESFEPATAVIDPISSLMSQGSPLEVHAMLTRLVDLLKSRRITSYLTSLVTAGREEAGEGECGISSVIDTWVLLSARRGGTHTGSHGLLIVKSRGTAHATDRHALVFRDDGIAVVPAQDGTPSWPEG